MSALVGSGKKPLGFPVRAFPFRLFGFQNREAIPQALNFRLRGRKRGTVKGNYGFRIFRGVVFCAHYVLCPFVCVVCVGQSKKPQKPRAVTVNRAQMARKAKASKARFTGVCLCLFVSLRGFPFAAHIYSRRRARFAIRRNTYFHRVPAIPNPGTPRPKVPANLGKRKGRTREGEAQPFKAKGKAREREKGKPVDASGKGRVAREGSAPTGEGRAAIGESRSATHNPFMLRLRVRPYTVTLGMVALGSVPGLGYRPSPF